MPKANTVPNYYIIDESGTVMKTDDEVTAKYYGDNDCIVIDVQANTADTMEITLAPEVDEGGDEAEED